MIEKDLLTKIEHSEDLVIKIVHSEEDLAVGNPPHWVILLI